MCGMLSNPQYPDTFLRYFGKRFEHPVVQTQISDSKMVRIIFWLGSLGIAAIAAFGYSQVTTSFDVPSVWRVVLFFIIGLTGLLSVFLFPQFKNTRISLFAIWIPAILLRLLLLPTAVSDDVSRYLFEGKLVRSGISPYAQTADAASIAKYRDEQWAMMNHKDKLTAYPPLAQFIFAAVGAISYQSLAYKLMFVLADLLTLAAILKLLKRRGLSLAFSGFYALNPVVLIAFAGEAHFDALMVTALTWGLFAYEARKTRLALIGISIAAGIKWITLPLIPFFLKGRIVFNGLLFTAILLIPAVYFLDSIQALFHGLFAFGGTRDFNGLLYGLLLQSLDLPRPVCNGIVLFIFVSVVVWRWLWRDRDPLDSHLRWILGTLIVVSPTVHFWYLAWIIPLVCLQPSLPWLALSITSGSYFFVWINATEKLGWSLDLWQRYLFWGPFFVFCLYGLLITKGRVLFPMARSSKSSQPSVGVVIPTLNAAKTLKESLKSIEQQTVHADEVIVVDAGSTDSTFQMISDSPLAIHVLHSDRGRGTQIATGFEAADSDWLLVLHADAILAPNAVDCMLRAVRSDRTIIGGALGQRFQSTNVKRLLIELLNDLRALFTNTAFGDQAQFFHREAAMRYQLMPKQPLMEDVESSWRTRERGRFVFLNQPCQVSDDKWHKGAWLKRLLLVLRLISKYRWARICGKQQAKKLSEKLYTEYYM